MEVPTVVSNAESRRGFRLIGLPVSASGQQPGHGLTSRAAALLNRPTTLITLQVVIMQLLSMAAFAIQAPLLGPFAFGAVALGMVVVGFYELVIGGVVTDTLLSVREIKSEHYWVATTFASLISLIFGIGIFLGSDVLAEVAGDRGLTWTFRAMAILPLLSALAAAPTAEAKRRLQFKPTLIRGSISLGLSASVGILLAVYHAGALALVAQALVYRLSSAMLMWHLVPLPFRLSWSRAEGHELGAIASTLVFARFMSWCAGQIPRFLLGLFVGIAGLGFYTLGARINDILIHLSIEPRTIPARVELRDLRSHEAALSRAAEVLLASTSVVCFPLCVGAAVVTPTLFQVWLDPSWQAGVFPVQMLQLCCIPYVTYYCCTAIFLALNQRRAELAVTTLQACLICVAVAATAWVSLNTASMAILLVLIALLPIPALLLQRRCGVRVRTIVAAQLPAFGAACIMAAVVTLAASVLASRLPSGILLLILISLGAGTYVLALAALAPHLVRERLALLFQPRRCA